MSFDDSLGTGMAFSVSFVKWRPVSVTLTNTFARGPFRTAASAVGVRFPVGQIAAKF